MPPKNNWNRMDGSDKKAGTAVIKTIDRLLSIIMGKKIAQSSLYSSFVGMVSYPR
jgi:hypothetical protein|tara:strand:+ start:130 stop:294 length:165 start_codon:yes stop_codon:yes gene_type:complete